MSRICLLSAVLSSGTGLLTACASSGAEDRAARSTAPAASAPHPCAHTGRGFALSLAQGRGGASSPEAAALRFVRAGTVPGYGSLSTRWVPESLSAHAVLLGAGDVWLHVLQLRD